jgi:hypothetical protein
MTKMEYDNNFLGYGFHMLENSIVVDQSDGI